MKNRILRAVVRLADTFGWLTSVSKESVQSFLSESKKGVSTNKNTIEIKKIKFDNFKKSNWSGAAQVLCVEVAHKDGHIAVRNSSDPQGITVYFSADEWIAFVKGVKDGEFDIQAK